MMMKHVASCATASALFAAIGCGMDAGTGDVPSASEVGETAQAIRGGTEVQRTSVVALDIDLGNGGWSGCTGVILNSSTILTAEHCVPIDSGWNAPLDVSVVYQHPGGDLECLNWANVLPGVGNRNPHCDTRIHFTVHTYPGHTDKDANTDLAVLVSDEQFVDVGEDDFADVDIDTLGDVDRMEFYGYGLNAYAGTGGGVERSGSGELDSYERHHFNLTASGARGCHGDSGAPATIYFDKTAPKLVVVGLFAEFEVTKSNTCSDDGTPERFDRLSPKMTWIEQQIGMTCNEAKSGGRRVKRCY